MERQNTEPTSDHANADHALRDAVLRLRMTPGVGPRTYEALLARFGSATDVLQATPFELSQVEGVGSKLAEAIGMAKDLDVSRVLDQCRQHGIDWVTRDQADYPELLREIYDPPSLLFRRGTTSGQDQIAIAIVGSRHATTYGRKTAESLARALAFAGVTVVSGLARGIDSAAHRAALDAGGRTIAVLGNGLMEVYPPENRELADRIIENGLIYSECLPDQPPRGSEFPRRNRLLSGLSLGVVVVEAASRSGALITARLATEQNREVFAVPGRIDSRMSSGCHRLIRDGAKLVQSVDDILEELGPLAHKATTSEGDEIRHPTELKLSDQEKQVLRCIDQNGTAIDDIVNQTGLPAPRVLSTLSVLEVRRLIRRVAGNNVIRSG